MEEEVEYTEFFIEGQEEPITTTKNEHKKG
jgi:hypothetical protein